MNRYKCVCLCVYTCADPEPPEIQAKNLLGERVWASVPLSAKAVGTIIRSASLVARLLRIIEHSVAFYVIIRCHCSNFMSEVVYNHR